jgi:hypothetical protein
MIEYRRVTELGKKCTLDVRDRDMRKRGGFAVSDTCGAPATSAVIDDYDYYLPRCAVHRGIIKLQLGRVTATMPLGVQAAP